jgi:amino acid transporter
MLSWLKRLVIGRPLPTAQLAHERLGRPTALAVFSSDALSSSAYATEEILLVLAAAGQAALGLSVPIALAIGALLVVVTASYRQTIMAYPGGGGAYIVARANLGDYPGLVAAAALLIDYVLTVSVSVAAGVAAVTSAFQQLYPYRVGLCVGAITLMALVNLRGVRESGRLFAVPTYLFIAGGLSLLGSGLVRYLWAGVPPAPTGQPMAETGILGTVLILRAFSSGCAALTGIEAISDGVPAFRPPEAANARTTLTWMSGILLTLFLGITVLAYAYGVVPHEKETVLSQLGRMVFGDGPFYYSLQAATMLILVLAANTAFADFPRLAYFLGRDRFLPRQFTNRGDRLVFSNGILILAGVSSLLLVIFKGDTHAIIPLYAVGVFLSFTLSQGGMVARWVRLRGPGWRQGAMLNGLGAATTAIVLLVLATTKFLHGAWIVVTLIPLLVSMFWAIHRHYITQREALSLKHYQMPEAITHRVVIPVAEMNRGVVNAIHYARSIAKDGQVEGVTVATDEKAVEELKVRWDLWAGGVPLVVLPSPERSLIRPIVHYVDELQQKTGVDFVTVVIPEFVPGRWWHHMLHNQSALLIKAAFLFRRGTIVCNVPYHLDR